MSTESDRRMLTVDEVAARFRVPSSWVYEHAAAGSLPSFKIGRYRRFDPGEIAAYLQAQRQPDGVES